VSGLWPGMETFYLQAVVIDIYYNEMSARLLSFPNDVLWVIDKKYVV
jgi:hypothetical protein